jgi:hypothetical protein
MRQVESSLNLDLSLPRSLRPCLGQGASLGEEAVLADSGRAGEVAARVGRVRSLALLSSLLKEEARRSGPLFKPDEVVVD